MYRYCLLLLFLLIVACGPYIGKATINVPPENKAVGGTISVVDRRGIEGIEVSGVMNTQQPHRIITTPSVATSVKNVLGNELGNMAHGDSLSVTILKNSCMLAHRLSKADASFAFQAEAQFTVAGKVYTKMLAAGYADESLPAGWGLDPSEVCPRYFEKALADVGKQAAIFYKGVVR